MNTAVTDPPETFCSKSWINNAQRRIGRDKKYGCMSTQSEEEWFSKKKYSQDLWIMTVISHTCINTSPPFF